MTRSISAVAAVTVLVLAGGCSQKQVEDPAESAFREVRSALEETDSESEKATLAEGFLAEFPDTERAGTMAATVAYYRGERLGEPERAYEVLRSALDRIQDPESRFEVGTALAPLAHELGHAVDLAEVAGDLAAVRELTFNDHLQVMETAVEVEQWELALEHSEASLGLASEEAYRADYPDREFSDQEVAERSRRRRVLALAHRGWALCNLERCDQGLEVFEEADRIKTVDYMGVSDTPLDLFWGRAMLARGEERRAIELLAADAAFGDAAEAVPLLRQAYAAVNQGEDGFDEYLWSIRERLAKPVDDFTLPDYEGLPHTLSALEDKVVLLAFWFPT